jgi:TolB protein
VTDATQSAGYPSWSPDERRLALEVNEPNGTQAAVLDLGTGLLRRLTSERGETWVRSWSPDGRRITAAAMREGQWSLRWIDAATAEQGLITPPAPPRVYYRYPEWSPDGKRVLFERGELAGNIWMIALP